jgi:hypothetical protein
MTYDLQETSTIAVHNRAPESCHLGLLDPISSVVNLPFSLHNALQIQFQAR